MPDRQPPHVIVTHNSVATKLLLRKDGPIDKTPTTGLSQVVTVGDTAQRSDQRTPQVILADQRNGEGLHQYTETEGNTSYERSQVDARWPNVLALPPSFAASAHGANTGVMGFVEYLDASGVLLIVWGWLANSTTSARRFDGSSTWTTITTGGTGIKNLTGYTYFNGYYLFATTEAAAGLHTSTDGATWANSAKAKACVGLAVHDNKVWTFNQTDKTLDYATDPTAAHGSWSTSAVLYLHPAEVVRQVVTWRDAAGREAIYLISNRRAIWYDEDADTFLDFDNLARRTGGYAPSTFYPRMHTSTVDGNAFITLYNSDGSAPKRDRIIAYSGVSTPMGPRVLPRYSPHAHVFYHLVDDGIWLYSFGSADGYPRVTAIGESGGFTTYYADIVNPGAIVGGGYGGGKLYALTATDILIPFMATDAHPVYTGGTYPAGTGLDHYFSYTDGGTPNMEKQALWVTLQCLKAGEGGDAGLSTNTLVAVYYRTDDSQPGTLIGSVSDSSTFPAVLPINSGAGVAFEQLQLYLTLSSGSSGYTPIVGETALAFIRQEVPRYAYTLVADLRSLEKQPLYAGLDLAQLMARVDSWTQPGAVVRLDFAGGDWSSKPDNATTVLNATVQYRAQEDPDKGPQQLTLVFSDVTPPASG